MIKSCSPCAQTLPWLPVIQPLLPNSVICETKHHKCLNIAGELDSRQGAHICISTGAITRMTQPQSFPLAGKFVAVLVQYMVPLITWPTLPNSGSNAQPSAQGHCLQQFLHHPLCLSPCSLRYPKWMLSHSSSPSFL